MLFRSPFLFFVLKETLQREWLRWLPTQGLQPREKPLLLPLVLLLEQEGLHWPSQEGLQLKQMLRIQRLQALLWKEAPWALWSREICCLARGSLARGYSMV